MRHFLENLESLEDDKIYVAPNIPSKKLQGAINSYAKNVKAEEIICLIDDTTFGSAKSGMVITSDCLYAKEDFESAVKVKLDIVDNFSIENGILETKLFVNGKKFVSLTIPSRKSMQLVVKYLNAYIRGENIISNRETQEVSSVSNVQASMATYYYDDIKEGIIFAAYPLEIIKYYGGIIQPNEAKENAYFITFNSANVESDIGNLDIRAINETILALNQLCIKMFNKYVGKHFGEIPLIDLNYDSKYEFKNHIEELKQILISIKDNFANICEKSSSNNLFESIGQGVMPGGILGSIAGGIIGAMADGATQGVKNAFMKQEMTEIYECLSYCFFGINVLEKLIKGERMYIGYEVILKG